MSILIVRHGETERNRARITQVPETPLGATGIAQAEGLARRLARRSVQKVLCSDLLRARMTAAPLLTRKDLPIRYLPELRERDFGDILGTPYAELEEDIYAEGYQPPNGESAPDFRERVAKAWRLVVRERSSIEGELLVITHGWFCRVLSEELLAFESGEGIPESFPNASLTVVDPYPPHRSSLVGCVGHLR